MLNENTSPIVVRRRKGTAEDPFINVEEFLTVTLDGKVTLSELPERYTRVVVEGEGITWTEIEDGTLDNDNYIVSYSNKLVTFNKEHVGKQLKFIYKGTGLEYVPLSIIYTKLEDGEVIETLDELLTGAVENIDKINDALEEIEGIQGEIVSNSNNAKNNAVYAKEQGDYAKEKGTLADSKAKLASEKASLAETATINVNKATADSIKVTGDTIKATSNAVRVTEETIIIKNNAVEEIQKMQTILKNLTFKGEYDSKVQYKVHNIVTYKNAVYLCINDVINVSPDITSHWKKYLSVKEVIDSAKQAIDDITLKGRDIDKSIEDVGMITENFRFMGEWNNTASYKVFNQVRHNGSTYICIKDNVNTVVLDGTAWQLSSIKGQDGDVTGVNSINGMVGEVIINANSIGAIPNNKLGIANGVARLNADGKVVNSNGDLVEGQVSSVNGKKGQVALVANDVDAYTKSETDKKINQGISSIPLASDIVNGKMSIAQYIKLNSIPLASTIETVTGSQNKVNAHANDKDKHITIEERKKWNEMIPLSQKGKALGIATLNVDGKVVDSGGNLVDGKVTSVNGQIGDVVISGYSTVSELNNHKNNESIHITTKEKEKIANTETEVNKLKEESITKVAVDTIVKSMNKIKKDITILSTGWVLDDLTSLYTYQISDAGITSNTIVNVNIHIGDLDKATDIKSACESFDGHVLLYADNQLDADIVCDLMIIKEVS